MLDLYLRMWYFITMKHRRFLISPDAVADDEALLTGETSRQITKVLRLGVGDELCLIDGFGTEYTAQITNTDKTSVNCHILSSKACLCDPKINLCLAMALPKSDKMDVIVQKATELGISCIMLMQTERVIAAPSTESIEKKLIRWRKIASEAAEQCGRATVPDICGMFSFSEVLSKVHSYSIGIIAWECETSLSLRSLLADKKVFKSVIFAVGSEGGFTDTEISDALNAGWHSVSLGRRILRAETAAVVMCDRIIYETEE